jgi:hypothetical protein
MASAGEWVKVRLLEDAPEPSPEGLPINELRPARIPAGVRSPPHVWLRSSIVFLGSLMDRFSRMWSVHVDWAAHHIINAAALEEMISLTVMDGIKATKRAPGGGKHLVEDTHKNFQGRGSRPAKYGPMLPTKTSGSDVHKHLGRSSRRAGWNHLTPNPADHQRGLASKASSLMNQLSTNTNTATDGPTGAAGHKESASAPISGSSSVASGPRTVSGNPWEAQSVMSNSGSVIRQDRAKHVDEETHVPNTERTGEVEYAFQACRQSYLECHVDASRAESLLKKCLRKWELDPRRQNGTLHDRNALGDREFRSKLPPFTTETIIGHKMRELAGGLYTVLLHMTVAGGQSHEEHGLFGSSGLGGGSGGGSGSGSPGLFSIFKSRQMGETQGQGGPGEGEHSQHGGASQGMGGQMHGLCLQRSNWEEVYAAVWHLIEAAIIDCLQLLIECAGIDFGVSVEEIAKLNPREIDPVAHPGAAKLREVVSLVSISCQLGLLGALEKLRSYNWTAFRAKKKSWGGVIDDTHMHRFLHDAEALVYAPVSELERGLLKDLIHAGGGDDSHPDTAEAAARTGEASEESKANMAAGGGKNAKNRDPLKINLKSGDVHRSEHQGFGSTHGVSIPLTPLYLRNDDPLVTGMIALIDEKVRETHSPRTDIFDRAAGAGEVACAQQ